MVKNPERFEKVGYFNEGYAVAKLADGRGYVIINSDGDISKIINEKGEKVDGIIEHFDILENSLDEAVFRNGVISFKDTISHVYSLSRSTVVQDRTLFATKSGYTFVDEINEKTIKEDGVEFDKTKKPNGQELFKEVYKNPEKYFNLVPGKDFKNINELRAFLDVVQHSMEQNFNTLGNDESVKGAIKFADRVNKKFKKWQKAFASENNKELLGKKIKQMGEVE